MSERAASLVEPWRARSSLAVGRLRQVAEQQGEQEFPHGCFAEFRPRQASRTAAAAERSGGLTMIKKDSGLRRRKAVARCPTAASCKKIQARQSLPVSLPMFLLKLAVAVQLVTRRDNDSLSFHFACSLFVVTLARAHTPIYLYLNSGRAHACPFRCSHLYTVSARRDALCGTRDPRGLGRAALRR